MRYPLLLSMMCLGAGVAEAAPPAGFEVCLTADACQTQFGKLGLIGYFYAGPSYPVPGCFRKGSNVYFGTEGTDAEMAESELAGVRERVWCEIPTLEPIALPDATSSTAPATEAALETTEIASTTVQATEASSTEATSSTVLASTAVPVTTEASSPDATMGADDSGSVASSSTVPATQAASSETTAASVEATAAIEGAGTALTTGPTSNGADEAADASPLEKEPVFLDVVDFTDPSSMEAAGDSVSSVPATEAAATDAKEAGGSSVASTVLATEPAATEATESGGSIVASTVPTTEVAAQTQPTEDDGAAFVETTEVPPLSDCPPAYDMGKSTYAQDELVVLGSQIFQCADSFYCNIAEWDAVLLEANPNAKELWDSAWALIGPCAGGTEGPVAIDADGSDTASRDEVDESPASSTKPKKDDVGEGKGEAAKIDSDKRPGGSGKKDEGKGAGSKNAGKGKDKGKSKSKNKGKVVQNKLLASTEQAELDDKKLWIVGAVFGGLCVALLGMYALKRSRRVNRVDDREYDGAFSAREDEVPPVTSVTWGDEGNEDGMVLESNKTEDYEAAITGRSRHSESRFSEDPSAAGNGSQMESRNASDLAGADACWTMLDCV